MNRQGFIEEVSSQIEALPKGELFPPVDFNELGSSEAVRLSLFRLEKEGIIRRVAQGIYVRPKESSLIGIAHDRKRSQANFDSIISTNN